MGESPIPTPLVSAEWLLAHAPQDPSLRIVDVRFSLADPLAGYAAYCAGHIPGAVYLNLETDLSAPLRPDRKGGATPCPPRRPLLRPSPGRGSATSTGWWSTTTAVW